MPKPLVRSSWRRAVGRFGLAVAPLLLAAGCRDEPVTTTCCLITFAVNPPSAELAPGDSLVVRVPVVGTREPPSVRWRSARPAVAPLDTTVAAGAPAILRAVGPGVDTVRLVVRFGRDSTVGGLPVVVRARP